MVLVLHTCQCLSCPWLLLAQPTLHGLLLPCCSAVSAQNTLILLLITIWLCSATTTTTTTAAYAAHAGPEAALARHSGRGEAV